MSLQDETGLLKGVVRTKDKAREVATESQWQMIEAAINAFAKQYPLVWVQFVTDTQKEKDFGNKWAEGKSESGKKMRSNFRKSAVFPTANYVDESGEIAVDSLLTVLEGIIPGLVHKDSVNFKTLLEKFPVFQASYKLNI